jgi:hypothetical protein
MWTKMRDTSAHDTSDIERAQWGTRSHERSHELIQRMHARGHTRVHHSHRWHRVDIVLFSHTLVARTLLRCTQL